MKNFSLFLLCFCAAIFASAQKINLADVYDYDYYTSTNKQLKNAHPITALSHFLMYGMGEGNAGSGNFLPSYYRTNNEDLNRNIGDNMYMYFAHYLLYGKNEGRPVTFRAICPPNTIDFDVIYNHEDYLRYNSDIKSHFSDPITVLTHFFMYGMKEGRRASRTFDPNYYRSHNADLNAQCGDNYVMYYVHYMLYGKSEGRQGAEAF